MHQQPGDRSCANEAIGGAHYGPVQVSSGNGATDRNSAHALCTDLLVEGHQCHDGRRLFFLLVQGLGVRSRLGQRRLLYVFSLFSLGVQRLTKPDRGDGGHERKITSTV
jgi:hypothetical protein